MVSVIPSVACGPTSVVEPVSPAAPDESAFVEVDASATPEPADEITEQEVILLSRRVLSTKETIARVKEAEPVFAEFNALVTPEPVKESTEQTAIQIAARAKKIDGHAKEIEAHAKEIEAHIQAIEAHATEIEAALLKETDEAPVEVPSVQQGSSRLLPPFLAKPQLPELMVPTQHGAFLSASELGFLERMLHGIINCMPRS